MRDVNAASERSLEGARAASAKNKEMALLNAQLMSEVNQLRASLDSKEQHINALTVRPLPRMFPINAILLIP
jgi:cell division septum initiation protein DivIVA